MEKIRESLIYGTAWKGEATKSLVEQAIRLGFRAIDTACQPKHYNEPAVGQGIQSCIQQGLVSREDIWIQTKFTPISGQDLKKPLPYDKNAPVEVQVKQSVETSLKNLETTYLDALILHSPMPTHEQTMQVWRAMEEIHDQGKARNLGISNIYNLRHLQRIHSESRIPPSIVQNRFYDETGWDENIREWCFTKDIRYESFWTLTANPHILKSLVLTRIAQQLNKTPEQVLYRYLLAINVTPLTGTTNRDHMIQDLQVPSIPFDASLVQQMDPLFQ